ncbi:MAG: sterol desaturase family protein [Mesorhizobium sp.]|uniref:sterol desaturase family protein n=1 Tax=Mesorhizobium sp. TaxID=1871066 RepID=UPI000FE970F3|nr:sterol desaturase family protein [Mesorhizobium sp.]RWE26383.1 MAG: sterol desaturase family protein [Mesorhizobium sp.]
MTDASKGDRPNTGGYAPSKLPSTNPTFSLPPRPLAILNYFFGWGGYLFPWQAIYMLAATAIWWFFIPGLETTRTFEFGWIAKLFVLNLVIIVLWMSILHWRLHVKRHQGTKYKFNMRWPKDTSTFLFGSQLWDNVFWTIASAVPIWTAYLAGSLWLMANGWIPYLDVREHPIYLGIIMLGIYIWQEIHFFAIHRLIHWPPLYKYVHSIHHKNSNPIPWSGLAMHPVEHLLYYSSVLIHWIIPSNPLVLTYHLLNMSVSAGTDHTGFAKVVFKGDGTSGEAEVEMDLSTYIHYLHHRFHEVNYGGNGSFPLDKWAGTFHDGSKEAHERMMARFNRNAPPPAGL